jgi:5-hydroxyisourate hydrolase
MSNPLTTHVLNTASGRPASGLQIRLERCLDGRFETLSEGVTNTDGRLAAPLIQPKDWGEGVYRIRFETGAYFKAKQQGCFYPYVEVVFEVTSPDEHHHVPLLLSPFGFSTYRGS